MQTKPTYSLDAEKLADAVSILDGEIEGLTPLLRLQRELGPRLIIQQYVFFAGVAVAWILKVHGWISSGRALASTAILFVVYMLLTFFLGRGELRAYARLRKAQRSLGLEPQKYIQFAGWKEMKVRLPRLIPMYGGQLFLLASIALSAFEYSGPWILDAGILFCAFGTAASMHMLTLRNLRFIPERLRAAEQLRESLLSHQKSSAGSREGATVFIPEVEYKEIARIERALINRDRQRAIKQSSRKPGTSLLVVQQSASVMRKKSGLDPFARLKIQARIDELSTNPLPPKAQKGDDGFWRLAVPETPWEISYTLAEDERCIIIHDMFHRNESKQQYQGG